MSYPYNHGTRQHDQEHPLSGYSANFSSAALLVLYLVLLTAVVLGQFLDVLIKLINVLPLLSELSLDSPQLLNLLLTNVQFLLCVLAFCEGIASGLARGTREA
jgi:hypothetical protein